MNRFETVEDPRRRRLVEALTVGAVLAGVSAKSGWAQGLFGSRKLSSQESIFRLTGSASVNGEVADTKTRIRPGDVIKTGTKSEIIFVVEGHAMILRSETHLVIEGEARPESENESKVKSAVISGLRLLTGKILSVSRDSSMRVDTAVASIGIRGTGWYAESEPDRTYFCTCYGATDISANHDPESKTTVVATHHDRPVYILGEAESGKAIRDAPFINHTDQELMLIESLVGRTPSFVFPKNDYEGQRRDYL